jgi:hypothetical protein
VSGVVWLDQFEKRHQIIMKAERRVAALSTVKRVPEAHHCVAAGLTRLV